MMACQVVQHRVLTEQNRWPIYILKAYVPLNTDEHIVVWTTPGLILSTLGGGSTHRWVA